MEKRNYKTKVPIVTIVIDSIFILLSTFILFLVLHNYSEGLSGLVSRTSEDDAIAGWYLLWINGFKFLGFFATLVLWITAFFYIVMIALVLGWNILMNSINKQEKGWIFVVGIMPSILFSLYIIVGVLGEAIKSSSIFMIILGIPAIVVLVQSLIQIHLFSIKEGKKEGE